MFYHMVTLLGKLEASSLQNEKYVITYCHVLPKLYDI